MLDKAAFVEVIKNTPLVSIDLIVRNSKNKMLVGYRKNQPAAKSWFVPGGRILKRESVSRALQRICRSELGRVIDIKHARFLGVYEHRYNTNFAKAPRVDTHYIVLAYELVSNVDLSRLPKTQHSDFRWVDESEQHEIHKNCRPYLHQLPRLSKDQYSTLNARRDSFDMMLWQTPGLNLVAQAFLFSILLNVGSKTISILVATVLSLLTSFAATQLLSKHRAVEEQLGSWLESYELDKGLSPVNRRPIFSRGWERYSSYRVWKWIIPTFGIVAIITCILRLLLSL